MRALRGPLFSLSASGRLTRALTLARRLSGPGWLLRGRPADSQTEPQLSWRTMWQLAASLWHDLSAAEQAAWEAAGTIRHMTGFAWYMSQALRPNPGIYLPLAGGTMSGEIDMHDNAIGGLVDPTTDDKAARKAYVDAHITAHPRHYFRRLNHYHFQAPSRGATNNVITANYLHAVPFISASATTLTALGLRVGTGVAGTGRLGVYTDDGSIYPAALISDCGTIDTSDAGNKSIAGLTIALAADTLYWFIYVQNAAASLYILGSLAAWQLIGSSAPTLTLSRGTWFAPFALAPLPDPFPAGATHLEDNRPAIGAYLT